jgi:hypothetical protein
MRLVVLALLASFVVGCAHDVHVLYPAAPDAPTGTLVLLLSQPASGVTVAIGGLLVVENSHTQKVVIEHVPVGNVDVSMAANGSDKQFRIWVDNINPTTVPLGVPEQQLGMLKSIFGSLISIVVYSLLR